MSSYFHAGTPRYALAFTAHLRGTSFNAEDMPDFMLSGDASYRLPRETEKRFRAAQEKYNIFRQISTIVHTENGEKKVKTILPFGAAGFVGENQEIPDFNTAFTSYVVKPHKIAKLAKVSKEMLDDAGFDVEGALSAEFGRAFGMCEENGILNGTGMGSPWGLLESSRGAEVAVTSAGTFDFDHIRKLYFALSSEYRKNASWLMSDEVALFVRSLKDNAGSPVWRDFDDTIFGKKVYTTPYMPSIASGAKPVLFGDFSQYWLFERGSVYLKRLTELFAEEGITGYVSLTLLGCAKKLCGAVFA